MLYARTSSQLITYLLEKGGKVIIKKACRQDRHRYATLSRLVLIHLIPTPTCTIIPLPSRPLEIPIDRLEQERLRRLFRPATTREERQHNQ
jgi:hypothetical protein